MHRVVSTLYYDTRVFGYSCKGGMLDLLYLQPSGRSSTTVLAMIRTSYCWGSIRAHLSRHPRVSTMHLRCISCRYRCTNVMTTEVQCCDYYTMSSDNRVSVNLVYSSCSYCSANAIAAVPQQQPNTVTAARCKPSRHIREGIHPKDTSCSSCFANNGIAVVRQKHSNITQTAIYRADMHSHLYI